MSAVQAFQSRAFRTVRRGQDHHWGNRKRHTDGDPIATCTLCSTFARSLEHTIFEQTNSIGNDCFDTNCICEPNLYEGKGDLCRPPGSDFSSSFFFCNGNTLLDNHFGFTYTITNGEDGDNIYYVITTEASGTQTDAEVLATTNRGIFAIGIFHTRGLMELQLSIEIRIPTSCL